MYYIYMSLKVQQPPTRTTSHSLDSVVTTSMDRHGYPELLALKA